MAVESIFYSVSGLSCRGALVWDESAKAPRPLLLMAPNWRGVIKPAIETGQTLAQAGYVVFVADTGRSVPKTRWNFCSRSCRTCRACAGASPPRSIR
jgi:hypothetical protein